MFNRLFRFFTRMVASAERDRIQAKFESIENRMDVIEVSQAEIKANIKSMHEIGLANAELLEGKLNLSRCNQEVIKDMIDQRFTFMDRAIEAVKDLIKNDR